MVGAEENLWMQCPRKSASIRENLHGLKEQSYELSQLSIVLSQVDGFYSDALEH